MTAPTPPAAPAVPTVPAVPAAPSVVPAAPAAPSGDRGYPENTPIDQMSVDQREAYWRSMARKHEDRVKALDGLTPDDLAALRAKAEKHDALEAELASDADKRAAEARKAAAAEADDRYRPQLVRAEFRVAAAGRIDTEKLAAILEPLNMAAFIGKDGLPDTDKVKAYVDGIIPPATGTTTPPRTGPSPSGLGNRAPAGVNAGDPARAWLAKKGITV